MTSPKSETRPIVIELNPPERRLYDRMRERLVAPRARREPSGLRDVALLLPDLTVLLIRLLRDERVAVGDKAVALLGVGYILSPIDLVPEVLLGPIGLVDDLLVLTACLSRVVNHVHPDVVRGHWPGQGDALQSIQRVTDWSERQIGTRLPAALRRIVFGKSPTGFR